MQDPPPASRILQRPFPTTCEVPVSNQERVFGPIPNVPVGTTYRDRKELRLARVHAPPMHGISGSPEGGADSIIVSGGYEDDVDLGDIVIYTGQGGNDLKTKKQVEDQVLSGGNLALVTSELLGLPVRVTRAVQPRRGALPMGGYRYSGVYRVQSHWRERGVSGYWVWRFLLLRLPDSMQESVVPQDLVRPGRAHPPTSLRGILSLQLETRYSRLVQYLHDYHCQACGTRLVTSAGPYCEAIHIVPLHRPHDGPDVPANILCLCPNDRFLFEKGSLAVADDLRLLGRRGTLRTVPDHRVDPLYLANHRDRLWARSG